VENDAAFIECDQALIRDLHAVRIALRFFGKLSAREESVPNRLIASRRRKERPMQAFFNRPLSASEVLDVTGIGRQLTHHVARVGLHFALHSDV
jgi:hypothetical protein